MTLSKAMLRNTFGSTKRVWIAAVLAALLGYVLCRGTMGMPLPPVAHPQLLLLPIAVSFMTLVWCALLAALGITAAQQQDPTLRLYSALPIGNRQLWWLVVIPQALVVLYALLLGAAPLVSIFLQFGASPPVLCSGMVLGVCGGISSMYCFGRRGVPVLLAALPLIGYGMYKAAAISLSPTATSSDKAVVALLFLVGCTVCILQYWHSAAGIRQRLTRHDTAKSIRTLLPDGALYFAKKYSRHAGMRLSWTVTLAMSTGICAWLYFSPIPVGSQLLLILSLLVAACCSDIRGISSRINPADSTALTGTYRFFIRQAMTCFVASGLATLPVCYIAIRQGVSVGELVIFVISGMTAGLFASTLIIPMRRDISSQIVATLLCLVMVMGIPYFVPLWTVYQTPALLCMSVVALAAALGIEYRRNTFRWRIRIYGN